MFSSIWNNELIIYLKSLGLNKIPMINREFPAIYVQDYRSYWLKSDYIVVIIDQLNWLEITITKDKYHYYKQVRNMLE